jgi:hypothetical protein
MARPVSLEMGPALPLLPVPAGPCNKVARFFLAQHTKTGEIYQITTTYTKWSQNRPNGRKIDQTAIKYTNIFHCKSLKKLPKSGFWVENMPSGNPALQSRIRSAFVLC